MDQPLNFCRQSSTFVVRRRRRDTSQLFFALKVIFEHRKYLPCTKTDSRLNYTPKNVSPELFLTFSTVCFNFHLAVRLGYAFYYLRHIHHTANFEHPCTFFEVF
jgi:hypothetical protein